MDKEGEAIDTLIFQRGAGGQLFRWRNGPTTTSMTSATPGQRNVSFVRRSPVIQEGFFLLHCIITYLITLRVLHALLLAHLRGLLRPRCKKSLNYPYFLFGACVTFKAVLVPLSVRHLALMLANIALLAQPPEVSNSHRNQRLVKIKINSVVSTSNHDTHHAFMSQPRLSLEHWLLHSRLGSNPNAIQSRDKEVYFWIFGDYFSVPRGAWRIRQSSGQDWTDRRNQVECGEALSVALWRFGRSLQGSVPFGGFCLGESVSIPFSDFMLRHDWLTDRLQEPRVHRLEWSWLCMASRKERVQGG